MTGTQEHDTAMATPKKAPENLQRRGPKPRGESSAATTTIRLTGDERAWLVDHYGGVSAGIVELIRQARVLTSQDSSAAPSPT